MTPQQANTLLREHLPPGTYLWITYHLSGDLVMEEKWQISTINWSYFHTDLATAVNNILLLLRPPNAK